MIPKMNALDRLRDEMNICRDCEICRTLLTDTCLVFPEMFRLLDRERETGEKISADELRNMIELCNFCGLCPCLPVRAAIIDFKTEHMDRYGLSFKTRAIENMERIGKLGGAIPQLTNFLFRNEVTKSLIESTVGIHRQRRFPTFPEEGFAEWIRKRKKNIRSETDQNKKVAYFAGCTARYLFPDVAKAVVDVFERNGVEVYYPEQQCCGIPCLLEGDRKLAFEFARFNITRLVEAVEAGYDIVCSCPTCGWMLKGVLKEGAYHSREYLDSATSDDGLYIKISICGGLISSERRSSMWFPKAFIKGALHDKGYFSAIDPKKRIKIAENTYDVGEYLRKLHREGELDMRLGPFSVRAAYYPPCHLREQRIGRPYQDLLSLIPELSIDPIDGIYCCGNAGIMGFKKEFHHRSIRIGSRLIAKIKGLDPDVLATDCLSCRIQFNQLTPYKVLHPIEIIKESYGNYQAQTAKRNNPRGNCR